MGFTVILGHSAEDLSILRAALHCLIQKLLGLVRLLLFHVGDGQQQLCVGGRLNSFSAFQKILGSGKITRLHE